MNKILDILKTISLIVIAVCLSVDADTASEVVDNKDLTQRVEKLESNMNIVGVYIDWSRPILDFEIKHDTLTADTLNNPYPTWKDVQEYIRKKNKK